MLFERPALALILATGNARSGSGERLETGERRCIEHRHERREVLGDDEVRRDSERGDVTLAAAEGAAIRLGEEREADSEGEKRNSDPCQTDPARDGRGRDPQRGSTRVSCERPRPCRDEPRRGNGGNERHEPGECEQEHGSPTVLGKPMSIYGPSQQRHHNDEQGNPRNDFTQPDGAGPDTGKRRGAPDDQRRGDRKRHDQNEADRRKHTRPERCPHRRTSERGLDRPDEHTHRQAEKGATEPDERALDQTDERRLCPRGA